MATQEERRLGIGTYAPSQLGQPEPDPNAGSAWRTLGRALMYSSDAEAIRERNKAAQVPTSTQQRPAEQPVSAQAAARQGYGYTTDPMQGPAMGMSVRNTSVDGIRRIDSAPGLNGPLFTNLPTGEAISGMQGGAVSALDMSGARAAAGRRGQGVGFQPDQAQQGPRASRIGGSDTQTLIDQFNTAYDQRRAAMQRGLRPGEVLARDRDYASALSSFLSSQGKSAELALDAERAASQSQVDQQRMDIDRQRVDLDRQRFGADQPLRDAQVRELEQRARPQGQAMPRVDGQVLRALLDTDPEQAKTYFADTENQRRAYGAAAQALAAAQQDGLTQQQIMSDPRLREAYITVYGPPRFMNGGVVPDYDSAIGYAQGGMVRGAGYGQTPQAAAVLPEVNEYRDYAMGAKSLGLPAVPFEQFLTLRQGAKQVAAAPQGAMAFANGGQVPDPRDVSGRMVMDTDPNAPTDSIPAMVDESMPAKLDSGEFVIPKDVVQFFGTDKLNKMIAQARQGQ